MTDVEIEKLLWENAYLKDICAQQQSDIVDLTADAQRLRQQFERQMIKRANVRPTPLSGGQ